MKITFKKALFSLMAVPTLAVGVVGLVAPSVNAADQSSITLSQGVSSAKGTDQVNCLFGTEAGCENDGGIFRVIVNVILFLIGAIAVIMLVFGGIKYTISNGDSNAVTSAKNTIMYAIVGLVVAILAYAIVNFVVTSISNTGD